MHVFGVGHERDLPSESMAHLFESAESADNSLRPEWIRARTI
jgi:hypothetical protein